MKKKILYLDQDPLSALFIKVMTEASGVYEVDLKQSDQAQTPYDLVVCRKDQKPAIPDAVKFLLTDSDDFASPFSFDEFLLKLSTV